MGYGNKSFHHINESEKRYILGLHKKMDLGNIFETKYKTDIQELISDFGKSLETQKRYLSVLFTNLPVSKSTLILNTIKEDTINNLFAQNKVVVENYYSVHNNILTEAVSDLISELERFHKFLNQSISLELHRLNEQPDNVMMRRALQTDKQREMTNKFIDAEHKRHIDWLNKAVAHIKEKGVGYFMEELRTALFSAPGTAIQILVALTGPATSGIGPAIVTGIWCILGLYDLYQITQGVDGAWANFIIDVICALTAGSLGGVLSKFVGTAGKTLAATLQNLMSKGMGPYITPVIAALKTAGPKVSAWFAWANVFLKRSLGISWLSDKVAPAIKYMGELVEQIIKHPKVQSTVQSTKQAIMPSSRQVGIVSPLGKTGYVLGKTVASLVPFATLRTTGALAAKHNPQVWGSLANLTPYKMGIYTGQALEQSVFKIIEKEINSRFKEKPTLEVLKWVDQNFGTAYSDAYLAYLGGKKMWKYQNGKLVSAVENIANAARGQANYSGAQAPKLQQGVGALVGDNPTSAQLSPSQSLLQSLQNVALSPIGK
jgi:hypothetical protein